MPLYYIFILIYLLICVVHNIKGTDTEEIFTSVPFERAPLPLFKRDKGRFFLPLSCVPSPMSREESMDFKNEVLKNPVDYKFVRMEATTDEMFVWRSLNPDILVRIPPIRSFPNENNTKANMYRSLGYLDAEPSLQRESEYSYFEDLASPKEKHEWCQFKLGIQDMLTSASKGSSGDINDFEIKNILVQSDLPLFSASIFLDIELHRQTVSGPLRIKIEELGGFVPISNSILHSLDAQRDLVIPPVLEEHPLSYFFSFSGSMTPPFSKHCHDLLYLVSTHGHLVIFQTSSQRSAKGIPLHQSLLPDFDPEDPIWLDPHFPIFYRLKKHLGIDAFVVFGHSKGTELFFTIKHILFRECFPSFSSGEATLLLPPLPEIFAKRSFIIQRTHSCHLFSIDITPAFNQIPSIDVQYNSIIDWKETKRTQQYAYQTTTATEFSINPYQLWTDQGFRYARPGITPFPFFTIEMRDTWPITFNMTLLYTHSDGWIDLVSTDPIFGIDSFPSWVDNIPNDSDGYLFHVLYMLTINQNFVIRRLENSEILVNTPDIGAFDETQLTNALQQEAMEQESQKNTGIPDQNISKLRWKNRKLWFEHIVTLLAVIGTNVYLGVTGYSI